jgi:hypothetical protein
MTHTLLLGSVPLPDTESVMTAAARTLDETLKRIPDGETGVRRNWIAWQYGVFAGATALEQTYQRERDYQLRPPFKVRDGCKPTDVRFAPLGFAREAKTSYGTFRRLKRDGMIRPNVRFMVALPTPWAPVYSYIAYADQRAVKPMYERALLAELNEILAVVPHDELAVQWDVATEMSWWERVYPAPFADVEHGVVDDLLPLAAAVPEPVELGLHLCYGSMNNRHWKEPADTANLVALANAISARVPRPIDFLHLPVPQNRDDDAYFAPLEHLAVPERCELYLGLLHLDDGVEGALRRIRTAQRHRAHFGIACECGLGRRPTESIPAWLALHAKVANALPDPA